jgi:hypothetical protein
MRRKLTQKQLRERRELWITVAALMITTPFILMTAVVMGKILAGN